MGWGVSGGKKNRAEISKEDFIYLSSEKKSVFFPIYSLVIKSTEESNIEAWNNDIPQTQHPKVVGRQTFLHKVHGKHH